MLPAPGKGAPGVRIVSAPSFIIHVNSRQTFAIARPSRPPLAPEPISSDDDDIDESYVDEARLPKRRSSPDPLNSLPHDLGPSDQTSKYDSTRIRGSDMLNPIIVPDGDDTAWAHNRYHTNDDPIEGSSDSAFPSLPYRNTHERDNDITQPLKIDLASKQKKPSGVAKNMKGKVRILLLCSA